MRAEHAGSADRRRLNGRVPAVDLRGAVEREEEASVWEVEVEAGSMGMGSGRETRAGEGVNGSEVSLERD